MTEVQPGQLLDGRFEISELIGCGPGTSVYRATDRTTGEMLAVKIPFLEAAPALYSRFQRELELGQRLKHPGLLRIVTVERPSRLYLAMEYLEGETLFDRLQRMHPLSINEGLRIAALICESVEYMHDHGVVHRDLNPTNIMVCRDGSLRLMDYGVAMTDTVRRLAFNGYVAPEQIRGECGDARTDLYSLGAILYEMATGHPPYTDQNDLCSVVNARLVGDPLAPRAYDETIPAEVEEIILHALARHPDDRYPTAAAMKAELLAPISVLVTGRVDRLQAASLGARQWRVVGIVALALMIPVLLFFVFLSLFAR